MGLLTIDSPMSEGLKTLNSIIDSEENLQSEGSALKTINRNIKSRVIYDEFAQKPALYNNVLATEREKPLDLCPKNSYVQVPISSLQCQEILQAAEFLANEVKELPQNHPLQKAAHQQLTAWLEWWTSCSNA